MEEQEEQQVYFWKLERVIFRNKEQNTFLFKKDY